MTELSGNPPAAEQLLMKTLAQITRVLGMTDEAWQRHANPWSVYTRFAAIPAMILAIWSRVWISWWALRRARRGFAVAKFDDQRSSCRTRMI